MHNNSFFVFFILFVFAIFLLHYETNISGDVVDVSRRFCTDSDQGIRPYTPGYIKSDIGTFNDRCQDNLHQIREYYCTEGHYGGFYQVSSTVVSCGCGYTCVRDVVKIADACVKS